MKYNISVILISPSFSTRMFQMSGSDLESNNGSHDPEQSTSSSSSETKSLRYIHRRLGHDTERGHMTDEDFEKVVEKVLNNRILSSVPKNEFSERVCRYQEMLTEAAKLTKFEAMCDDGTTWCKVGYFTARGTSSIPEAPLLFFKQWKDNVGSTAMSLDTLTQLVVSTLSILYEKEQREMEESSLPSGRVASSGLDASGVCFMYLMPAVHTLNGKRGLVELSLGHFVKANDFQYDNSAMTDFQEWVINKTGYQIDDLQGFDPVMGAQRYLMTDAILKPTRPRTPSKLELLGDLVAECANCKLPSYFFETKNYAGSSDYYNPKELKKDTFECLDKLRH